jgi:hypothetical protein
LGSGADLVYDHHIDQALADIREQLLQRRPFHRPAGEATVAIGGLEQAPALARRAADIRLAGLALRVQRVVVLLQAFF